MGFVARLSVLLIAVIPGFALASEVCYFSGNLNKGGTAVYEYKGDYVWALNNSTISKSSSSTITVGAQAYRRGSKAASYSLGRAGTLDAYQLCVVNMNTAPSVAARSMVTAEDTQTSIVMTASDPDAGSYHTFQHVSGPGAGSVSIAGATLTYTPPANWSGVTTLTYRAIDNAGAASNIGTITVTVNPVNDSPAAVAGSLSTNEDTPASVALGVVDPDIPYGDTHVYEIVSGPGSGAASISGATLTYTPPANWYGSTSLTYRVRDAAGVFSNTATVTVTVNPVNDIPIAQAKTLTVLEDNSGVVALTATDIDSPTPSVFQLVSSPNPTQGTASISGGTLTFVPAANWNGVLSFNYRAQDSSGAWSVPVTVSITVTAVNDTPEAVGELGLRTIENKPASVKYNVSL